MFGGSFQEGRIWQTKIPSSRQRRMPRDAPTRALMRHRHRNYPAGANYPSHLPIPGTEEIVTEQPASRKEVREMWKEARLRALGKPPVHRTVDWLQVQLQSGRRMDARQRVVLERLRILRGRVDAGSMHTSDPSDGRRMTEDLEEEADLRESEGASWRDLVGYL
jgi:hypothetical protein